MCTTEIVFRKFLILCIVWGRWRVECDTDYLSVDDIKGIVIELGYSERRIKKIYYRKPNLPFEDSLVSIESDEEVCELIVLSKSFEYLSLYVKHNNEHQSVEDDKYDDMVADLDGF